MEETGACPRGREWALLAGIALLSFVGINAYTFPGSNHFISVPFIRQLLDPGLYPGDPLLAEREHFHTLYNGLLAGLVRLTGLRLEWVFHLGYLVALAASLPAFFRLAMAMTGQRQVALCATTLFSIGCPSLAGTMTLEPHLMERSLVLPLQLWALAVWVGRRELPAFALLGLSFTLHPLSALYCAGAMACGSLLARDRDLRRLSLGLLVFALLSAPVALPRLLGEGPRLPLWADPAWLDLLLLRSPHHIDPHSWPWWQLLGATVLSLGFVVLARRQRLLLGFGLGVLLMCGLGYVLVKLEPMTLVVQLQLFRSFRFLVYLALVLVAARLLAPLPAGQRWAAAAVFAVFGFGLDAQLYRLPGVLALLLVWTLASLRRAWLLAVALCVSAFCGWLLSGGGPWIGDALDPRWRAVQDWARQSTPADAVFIVPPRLAARQSGFRVYSERSSFGAWKDGTQAFFNPTFGELWLRRMRALGFSGDPAGLRAAYRDLDVPGMRAAAALLPDPGAVYAVVESRHRAPLGVLPLRFENRGFRVHQIR